MKENKNLKTVLAIIGGVVALSALVFTLVHFWDQILSKLPCKKNKCEEGEELLDGEEVAEEDVVVVALNEQDFAEA